MKYFTPDLLARYGSEDDSTALAAHDELERRSDQYARDFAEVRESLPARFREMLERFYLHDTSVEGELPGPSTPTTRESFYLVLRLDNPPGEKLVLDYRDAEVEVVQHSGLEPKGVLAWLQDEVEVAGPGEGFRHSILFSDDVEVRIRFRDFDFATLRPNR